MLRRRTDNAFEFRIAEMVLQAGTPATLDGARREALRLRIMSQLAAQDPARNALLGAFSGSSVRERWVLVPAGLGIAATLVVAIRWMDTTTTGGAPAHASVPVSVDGIEATDAHPGQLIVARFATWLAVGDDVRIGMDDNSALRFSTNNHQLVVAPEFGSVTVASTVRPVTVQRSGLSVVVSAQSTAQFFLTAEGTRVTVHEGSVTATWAGVDYPLTRGATATFGPGHAPGVAGGTDTPVSGSANLAPRPAQSPAPGSAPGHSADPSGSPSHATAKTDAAGPGAEASNPAGVPGATTGATASPSTSNPGGASADAPPANATDGHNSLTAAAPPENANAGGGTADATPPEHSNAGGSAATPTEPPANWGAVDPPATSNPGGNSASAGTPPANSNAGGNSANAGTPPANSNAGGNSANAGTPPAKSNSGGNSANAGTPPANSNAGGNSANAGTPPANSNAGGNSAGAGTPPANSNAGGNSAKNSKK